MENDTSRVTVMFDCTGGSTKREVHQTFPRNLRYSRFSENLNTRSHTYDTVECLVAIPRDFRREYFGYYHTSRDPTLACHPSISEDE